MHLANVLQIETACKHYSATELRSDMRSSANSSKLGGRHSASVLSSGVTLATERAAPSWKSHHGLTG